MSEQRAYIKIETIRGETVAEIHSALCEVCEMDTMDRYEDGLGDPAMVL